MLVYIILKKRIYERFSLA